MNFEIIPNQQTPGLPELPIFDSSECNLFIEKHRVELDGFLEFAKTQSTAVGLAANQCSLDGERFMMRVFALRNLKTNKWSLVINPYITKYLGIKESMSEGCLTWKNQKIIAERNWAVEVDYFNIDGERITGDIRKGFESQIWQHEINHLNGIEEMVVSQLHPDPIPIKPERNELCPCGSGLKFKKCCLSLL